MGITNDAVEFFYLSHLIQSDGKSTSQYHPIALFQLALGRRPQPSSYCPSRKLEELIEEEEEKTARARRRIERAENGDREGGIGETGELLCAADLIG